MAEPLRYPYMGEPRVQDPTEGRDLLSVRTVADLLDVSGMTVHRWIREGRIPARDLNPDGQRRMYRVAAADFRAFRDSLPKAHS